jgi:hypothetical protein
MDMSIQDISFTVDRVDSRVIHEIAERAMKLTEARAHDFFSKMDVAMDLTAVHANGNPLRLEGLRDADDFNFAHDILGIRRHLNRETGRLEDGFRPRFSMPRAACHAAIMTSPAGVRSTAARAVNRSARSAGWAPWNTLCAPDFEPLKGPDMTHERNLDSEAAIISNDLSSLVHRIEMLQANQHYTNALTLVQKAYLEMSEGRTEIHQAGMRERFAGQKR